MDSEFYKESERPRGLLTVGMPGTGKTTFAKAIASVFQWPLIEMDIAQMKAAVQGATEQNMLNATSTVMTINRCIMLIDEVEKALGGVESSNSTDGGTLMGIFNRLLQFMEDDSHSAVVMMTANGFKDIPPALMRSGRIDLVVYAALPSIKTRESIFKIHLAKTAFPTELEPEHIKQLALKTGDYSGAEIESAIYHSKWNLAASGKLKNVKPDELYSTILRKIGEIKPVARSRADDLKALKDWAEVYALSTEE